MHCYLSASIWLVLACLAPAALAQVPFPGKCPEVKVMESFDLDAYMGIWYEHSKYPFAFEIAKKCIYAKYERTDNDTVAVMNAAINRLTGNPSNVTGTAKVLAPAQLAVVFSQSQRASRANYLVLSTDYESYAVVYSCTNLPPLAHLKMVWILTRLREPNSDTLATAQQVLDDNKIKQALMIDTTQTGCPNLNGDADNSTDTNVDLDWDSTTVVENAIDKA